MEPGWLVTRCRAYVSKHANPPCLSRVIIQRKGAAQSNGKQKKSDRTKPSWTRRQRFFLTVSFICPVFPRFSFGFSLLKSKRSLAGKACLLNYPTCPGNETGSQNCSHYLKATKILPREQEIGRSVMLIQENRRRCREKQSLSVDACFLCFILWFYFLSRTLPRQMLSLFGFFFFHSSLPHFPFFLCFFLCKHTEYFFYNG